LIKFAKPEDIAQIAALAFKTYNEVELEDDAPEFDMIVLVITQAVMTGVVLVRRNEEDDNLIDGVVVLDFTHSWWSRKPLLQQKFFYVKPEFRKTSLAKQFLKAVIEYGTINRIKIIFDFVGKDFHRKAKLAQRMGFTTIGQSCIF
jgi:L-amino acid N-acyltransferase YncA